MIIWFLAKNLRQSIFDRVHVDNAVLGVTLLLLDFNKVDLPQIAAEMLSCAVLYSLVQSYSRGHGLN